MMNMVNRMLIMGLDLMMSGYFYVILILFMHVSVCMCIYCFGCFICPK